MKIQSILNEVNLEGTKDLRSYGVEELDEIVFEILDVLGAGSSSYSVEDSNGKFVVAIEDKTFDLNAEDSPRYLTENIINSLN